MKTEMTSLELHFLLKELQELISAKVEQIYQIGKEELVLQLHVPSKGKRILRIVLGKLMYIASNKGEVPEKPHGFCLFLRKKLRNSRLRELRQLGFERIVEFLFETREQKFRLVIELFSKGNIVLCDELGMILSALEQQKWKDRTIMPKHQYDYPKKEYNILTVSREQLTELLHKSQKENLVKTLAIDLGLGGTYSEELCIIAGVDKNLKANQLSDKETYSIYQAIQSILTKDISPLIMYSDEEKSDVKDIVPFGLEHFADLPSSSEGSFNQALDSVLTTKAHTKAIETAEKKAKSRIDKVNEMIFRQRMRIEGLEVSEKDNQRKGEIIYENYPLVKQVLDDIAEMRKDLSWKEISAKFKGHKIIRGIDPKTGEITIDL